MASKITTIVKKKTTNITGLLVSPNPHHQLGVLYKSLLGVLGKLPEHYPYRKYTEEVVKQRAQIINSTPDLAEIERQINCGQVEEMIVQAENELNLARKFVVWKPWEQLQATPPENQWTWPPVK